MKEDKQNKYKSNSKKTYENATYIDGSAVRKAAPMPDYEREYDPDRRKRSNPQRQQNAPKKHKNVPARRTGTKHRIDFFTMSFLSAALLLTVYVCIAYLQDQTNIREINKEILALEKELSNINAANNSTAVTLDQAIDFDYVYEVAVGELGMVFPNENEVINYEKPDHDYVRQYKEIPEIKLSTLLDKLLP